MRRLPVLLGYDLSSDIGPTSHTTIIAPSREARTSLFIRLLLIRELAVLFEGLRIMEPRWFDDHSVKRGKSGEDVLLDAAHYIILSRAWEVASQQCSSSVWEKSSTGVCMGIPGEWSHPPATLATKCRIPK
ncbi:hypothetical protein AVEN_43107-1 [Araneus ventricosus]|uniref:Uncharacterized protein n=1 Tax=Araneus ventricosus TaxID=182803 RepID=A0A4Y2UZ19_ARAVE|nr:hypothetical protein AVEN_43107-1 [Araneus ventricosus]